MDKKMIYGVAGCGTLVVAMAVGIARVVKSRKKKETNDEKPAEVVETET